VARAEQWRWSSSWRRLQGADRIVTLVVEEYLATENACLRSVSRHKLG